MAGSIGLKKPRRKRTLHWESLIGEFPAGDYRVVPLLSSDALREEGESMDHCVGQRYPRWCKTGAVRVFSIRDMLDRHVATASIYFDFETGHWRLEQCRGPKNREVCENGTKQRHGLDTQEYSAEPTDLYFLAREIVRRYQHAHDEHNKEST
jgi:hypothetical protein